MVEIRLAKAVNISGISREQSGGSVSTLTFGFV
jgi:hypothetical protein